jgi:hypothetical protein
LTQNRFDSTNTREDFHEIVCGDGRLWDLSGVAKNGEMPYDLRPKNQAKTVTIRGVAKEWHVDE